MVFEGSPIMRPRLIRLFASVLRRDNDEYLLVTPVEACRIHVTDVPFTVVLADVGSDGAGDDSQSVIVTTNVGDTFTIDQQHPLRVGQTGPSKDCFMPTCVLASTRSSTEAVTMR